MLDIPPLKIGSLTARIPVIQGGMGVGISLANLASAVAREGGIGVLATAGIGMFEPDLDTNPVAAHQRGLKKELAKAKSMAPEGIIGVNVMVALSDFGELVACAVEHGADILFLGAGLPLKLPKTLPLDNLDQIKTQFVPIVSSARAAELIFRSWDKQYDRVPDAIVVEGPLAGGHLGFKKEHINDPEFALEKLLPPVIEVARKYEDKVGRSIPVIAAGGVYTGADIYRFLEMGASGVQMATRFVATHECDASDAFKQAHLDCKQEDIILIDSPVGMPGRAIRNDFLSQREAGIKESFNCPWKCLHTCQFKKAKYCIAKALTQAQRGHMENGFAFAGANAWRNDKLVSVKELIDTLMEEYQQQVKG